MSGTYADRIGLSGSIYSFSQNKKTVNVAKDQDIYNQYLDDAIPKPDIMELKLVDIWNRLVFVVRTVLGKFWSMWQSGNRNWRDYWTVLTTDDYMLYFGIFLVILSFVLYVFF